MLSISYVDHLVAAISNGCPKGAAFVEIGGVDGELFSGGLLRGDDFVDIKNNFLVDSDEKAVLWVCVNCKSCSSASLHIFLPTI